VEKGAKEESAQEPSSQKGALSDGSGGIEKKRAESTDMRAEGCTA